MIHSCHVLVLVLVILIVVLAVAVLLVLVLVLVFVIVIVIVIVPAARAISRIPKFAPVDFTLPVPYAHRPLPPFL
jgi:hypothetical protein